MADPAAWTMLWDAEAHQCQGSELMERLMHYRDDSASEAREPREIWHFEPNRTGDAVGQNQDV